MNSPIPWPIAATLLVVLAVLAGAGLPVAWRHCRGIVRGYREAKATDKARAVFALAQIAETHNAVGRLIETFARVEHERNVLHQALLVQIGNLSEGVAAAEGRLHGQALQYHNESATGTERMLRERLAPVITPVQELRAIGDRLLETGRLDREEAALRLEQLQARILDHTGEQVVHRLDRLPSADTIAGLISDALHELPPQPVTFEPGLIAVALQPMLAAQLATLLDDRFARWQGGAMPPAIAVPPRPLPPGVLPAGAGVVPATTVEAGAAQGGLPGATVSRPAAGFGRRHATRDHEWAEESIERGMQELRTAYAGVGQHRTDAQLREEVLTTLNGGE